MFPLAQLAQVALEVGALPVEADTLAPPPDVVSGKIRDGNAAL